jgi:hypothetical protein
MTETTLLESHRELQRRLNNFLTVCMTHAESALESEAPDEMAEALHWIRESARGLAPHARAGVQRLLPFEEPRADGRRESREGAA